MKRFVYWQILLFILQGTIILLPVFIFQPSLGYELYAFSGAYVFIALVSYIIASSFDVKGLVYILPLFGVLAIFFGLTLNLSYFGSFSFVLTWLFNVLQGRRIELYPLSFVLSILLFAVLTTVISIIYAPDNVFNFETRLTCFAGSVVILLVQVLVYLSTFYKLPSSTQTSFKNHENQSLKRLLSDLDSINSSSFHLLLWNIAQSCPKLLHLEDFVIYIYNPATDSLVQIAAYGNKAPEGAEIVTDPIEIVPGKGVVGTCFLKNEVQLLSDVSNDPNYIVDDLQRASELAVPIISNGTIIGVIDSENSTIGFFNEGHVKDFELIAAFCATHYEKGVI